MRRDYGQMDKNGTRLQKLQLSTNWSKRIKTYETLERTEKQPWEEKCFREMKW